MRGRDERDVLHEDMYTRFARRLQIIKTAVFDSCTSNAPLVLYNRHVILLWAYYISKYL